MMATRSICWAFPAAPTPCGCWRALIHKVGLIAKQQVNLAGSGLTAYKQFSSDTAQPDGGLDLKQFTGGGAGGPRPRREGRPGGAICAHPFGEMADHQIRRGLGHRGQRHRAPAGPVLFATSLQVLAFVHRNPSIEIFRQAISIDERRRLFRLQPWNRGSSCTAGLGRTDHDGPQDSLQVWFAGVHADIGGGYPEIQSGPVEIPVAVDDRGSREMRPQRRPPHRQSARLGPATEEQSVQLCQTGFHGRPARFDDGRLARA